MSFAATHAITLKSKPHFMVLDGLRGIAALAIVMFHYMEMIYADFTQNFIAHGFLAVDFFFCLSGFVIAYAYDDRIGKMGILEFFRSRIIRLHPLIILGSVLGVLAFLFDPFNNAVDSYSPGKIFLLFLSSAFLVPMPAMEDRGFNLFGLNAPAWSLFWEYIANIMYAFILFRLGRSILAILTVLAAILLFYVALQAGNLLGGWSGGTFWEGGARILYSFLAGMVIYRYKLQIKNKLGFFGMTILILLAFIFPFSNDWGWMYQTAVVLFYFPLLVALGAGTEVSSAFKNLCKWSGDISYPLYMTHYACMWIFYKYYTTYLPTGLTLFGIVFLGIILQLTIAYMAMKWYDIPIRNYLISRNKR